MKIGTRLKKLQPQPDDSDNRHADNFWSAALANYAASSKRDFEKPFILSGNPYKNSRFNAINNFSGIAGQRKGFKF